MTIKDVIENLQLDDIVIMQRFYWKSPQNEMRDELYGYCQYRKGELTSLDGDSYCLYTEISDYKIETYDGTQYLVVHEKQTY